MKTFIGLLMALLLTAFTATVHAEVTREYQTNYGTMTLHFNGAEVSGNYTHQGGQIQGTLSGHTMTCSWQQNNGSGNCLATFSHDFSKIDLQWNYSGESSWRGGWYGTFVRQYGTDAAPAVHHPGIHHHTKIYNTNYGVMTLHFQGRQVTGSYTHQGGQIQGELSGHRMPCHWQQNNGSGKCLATFSHDFNSIDLQWNYKGESHWRSGWSGTLQQ